MLFQADSFSKGPRGPGCLWTNAVCSHRDHLVYRTQQYRFFFVWKQSYNSHFLKGFFIIIIISRKRDKLGVSFPPDCSTYSHSKKKNNNIKDSVKELDKPLSVSRKKNPKPITLSRKHSLYESKLCANKYFLLSRRFLLCRLGDGHCINWVEC